jgi:hypothetical protein
MAVRRHLHRVAHPIPVRQSRRRATEPVASLATARTAGGVPGLPQLSCSTDFLMSVRKELLRAAAARHLPAPTGVLNADFVNNIGPARGICSVSAAARR